MVIKIKEILIEAYNLIGKIERYYALLQYVYKIIYNEFRGTNTSAEISLQIAVKAINDSVGPNGIIPILLVFGAYPRLTEDLLPLVIVTRRTETIRKTTKEIKYLYA
jgi:hypothetical protein